MVTLSDSPMRLAVGAIVILLGIAWVIDPMRMSRLQEKYLYLSGDVDRDVEGTKLLIVRASGIVLAALGVLVAIGYEI